MPPRCRASMDRMADSAEEVRTTGTTPISRIDARICCLFIYSRLSVGTNCRAKRVLPIDHAAVVLIVAFLVPPIVANFVCHRILIQLDSETWSSWKLEIAFANFEWRFDVAFPERHLFLNQEIRNGGRHLDTGRKRNRTQGIVRCNTGVIGLGHSRNEANLRDPARMAKVRLQDGCGALLE